MKKRLGGWDYVVAAIKIRTSKPAKKEHTGRKKRGTRKPDGAIRPSTKLVLIVLSNHRNHITGQCNPSHATLMDETGYGKRTIVFELQALKELGLIDWKRGWSNDHGKVSNRYSLNLKAIQTLEQSAAEEEEGSEQSAAVTNKVQRSINKVQRGHEQSALSAPLTSKEPPILEPPRIEPSERCWGNTLKQRKPKSEAESEGHRQVEQSAPGAPSSKSEQSAPGAPSSEPVRRTLPEILADLPNDEQWALYRRSPGGKYGVAEAEAALTAYRAKQSAGMTR